MCTCRTDTTLWHVIVETYDTYKSNWIMGFVENRIASRNRKHVRTENDFKENQSWPAQSAVLKVQSCLNKCLAIHQHHFAINRSSINQASSRASTRTETLTTVTSATEPSPDLQAGYLIDLGYLDCLDWATLPSAADCTKSLQSSKTSSCAMQAMEHHCLLQPNTAPNGSATLWDIVRSAGLVLAITGTNESSWQNIVTDALDIKVQGLSRQPSSTTAKSSLPRGTWLPTVVTERTGCIQIETPATQSLCLKHSQNAGWGSFIPREQDVKRTKLKLIVKTDCLSVVDIKLISTKPDCEWTKIYVHVIRWWGKPSSPPSDRVVVQLGSKLW